MTTCSKMLDSVESRVEDGKSADEIGKELCDIVIDKKRKAKYLINLLAVSKKMTYKDYVEAHPTLGLQPQKARKKKITDEKLSEKSGSQNTLVGMMPETFEDLMDKVPRYAGRDKLLRKIIERDANIEIIRAIVNFIDNNPDSWKEQIEEHLNKT